MIPFYILGSVDWTWTKKEEWDPCVGWSCCRCHDYDCPHQKTKTLSTTETPQRL